MTHQVLLVEDDFLIATLSKAMLEAIGCEVIGPVPSVDRALKMIEETEIDAAVLDVQIIGGTSIPVAQALVAKGIPVVFVSGFADLPELPEDLKDCLRLEKPVLDDELANAIYRMLGKPAGR